jgi:septal ring factor EnvC (AmiA/AmiB activator)
MKITQTVLRQLIRESIHDRIKMIDEAGEQAKLKRLEEEIGEINQMVSQIKQQTDQEIQSLLASVSPEDYATPEKISDQIDAILDKSRQEIAALIGNKNELKEYVTQRGEERQKLAEKEKKTAKGKKAPSKKILEKKK